MNDIYVIRCETTNPDGFYVGATDYGCYWSNDWGWGSLEGCERFTDEEARRVRLPIGGYWRNLKWATDYEAERQARMESLDFYVDL